MVERKVQKAEQFVPNEKLVRDVYSSAVEILGKYGATDPLHEGKKVKTHFCDDKDIRKFAEITFSTDASKGSGSIKISVVRERIDKESAREEKDPRKIESTRAIHMNESGITMLVEMEKDLATHSLRRKYIGPFTNSRFDLNALRSQIAEAEINLDAEVLNAPCRDENPSGLIQLIPRVKTTIANKLHQSK